VNTTLRSLDLSWLPLADRKVYTRWVGAGSICVDTPRFCLPVRCYPSSSVWPGVAPHTFVGQVTLQPPHWLPRIESDPFPSLPASHARLAGVIKDNKGLEALVLHECRLHDDAVAEMAPALGANEYLKVAGGRGPRGGAGAGGS
jgi:hypothetical protein